GEVSNPKQTSGNGWDFAVLTATDPIESLLKASDLDHALRLNTEIPEPVLQSLESLPVEAILLPEPKGDLTLETLMPYYRVAQSTSKPVLAELSQGNESAIMALRDAGIVGIIITADSVSKAKNLNIAKQAISTLPPKRAKRRSQKPTASLGLTPGPISRGDDDDD
ncbi:hypothetical protein M1O29_03085, partial [Dehalococcoidia bacterium]|nr:hypothetical protein [Dehalococcoidia bacterium]